MSEHVFLYYEIGECNDSLRDRTFYAVYADIPFAADCKLRAYVNSERGEHYQLSQAQFEEEYGVFLEADNMGFPAPGHGHSIVQVY